MLQGHHSTRTGALSSYHLHLTHTDLRQLLHQHSAHSKSKEGSQWQHQSHILKRVCPVTYSWHSFS